MKGSSSSGGGSLVIADDEEDCVGSTVVPPVFTFGGPGWQPLYPLEIQQCWGWGWGWHELMRSSTSRRSGWLCYPQGCHRCTFRHCCISFVLLLRLTATAEDLLERFRAMGFAQREA